MRAPSHINRGIAILLLLIFFQQTGAVLYIHNLVHEKNASAQNAENKESKTGEVSFSCNCIDNFLIPYIEPGDPCISQKSAAYITYHTSNSPHVFLVSPIFFCRRGPPVSHI